MRPATAMANVYREKTIDALIGAAYGSAGERCMAISVAVLAVDGRDFAPVEAGLENGYWLGATLFDNVTPDMSIYREEIFGPVLACVREPTWPPTQTLQMVAYRQGARRSSPASIHEKNRTVIPLYYLTPPIPT
jgi:acyl-CoA reductase-like NAD-dependent aldehyde dehydrogenase